jgi:phosphatidylserine/phosphatidylglycerophosphate/cardiolipin synthase-like enzyme
VRVAKKFKLFILSCIAALYSLLIWAALDPQIPSASNPVVFYSNQRRDDLRLVLKKLFSKAQASIDVTMYAATDPELLQQLTTRAQKGLRVQIRHDPSNPIDSPLAIPTKAKGLMHRKIVLIDDQIVLLGSANMTTSSLLMHDNLSVALNHPPLAEFLKKPTATTFDFEVQDQKAKVWLLPDPSACLYLQKQLEEATESVFIAMFTLTHPDLIQTLVQLHQKGLKVTIAIDHYAARGASKKAIQRLQSKGVEVIFSQGLQLLHHKWAYIDQKKVILGSTNWTKAAFTKNQDCLLFLNNLTKPQQRLLNSLCNTIRLESNNAL